jgi:hypothetical protein
MHRSRRKPGWQHPSARDAKPHRGTKSESADGGRLHGSAALGTTRTDIVYNVVNNTVVSTHTIAVTGIDWHVA